MKRQGIKAQRISKEKRMEISPGFRALATQIKKVKDEQNRLGLLCHDRELLSCPRCDIEEDVTFEGFLIVVQRLKPDRDTGLRFAVVDEERGIYQCPGCGEQIVVPAEPEI